MILIIQSLKNSSLYFNIGIFITFFISLYFPNKSSLINQNSRCCWKLPKNRTIPSPVNTSVIPETLSPLPNLPSVEYGWAFCYAGERYSSARSTACLVNFVDRIVSLFETESRIPKFHPSSRIEPRHAKTTKDYEKERRDHELHSICLPYIIRPVHINKCCFVQ